RNELEHRLFQRPVKACPFKTTGAQAGKTLTITSAAETGILPQLELHRWSGAPPAIRHKQNQLVCGHSRVVSFAPCTRGSLMVQQSIPICLEWNYMKTRVL